MRGPMCRLSAHLRPLRTESLVDFVWVTISRPLSTVIIGCLVWHCCQLGGPASYGAMLREQNVSEKIKIRLEAYDHRILDKAVQDIVDTAKRTGAKVAGPIPMPTRIEKFTVLRSPHVNKKSREQFEIRTHKRMVEILDPTAKTNELFSKVDVPAGVDITIRQTVR